MTACAHIQVCIYSRLDRVANVPIYILVSPKVTSLGMESCRGNQVKVLGWACETWEPWLLRSVRREGSVWVTGRASRPSPAGMWNPHFSLVALRQNTCWCLVSSRIVSAPGCIWGPYQMAVLVNWDKCIYCYYTTHQGGGTGEMA